MEATQRSWRKWLAAAARVAGRETLTSLSDPGLYAGILAVIEIGTHGLGHLWTAVVCIAADPGTQILGWLGALLRRLVLHLSKRQVRIAAGFGIDRPGLPV
ncbi:hypothetical protein E3O53_07930 [Cryobacterium sp. TMT2-18-3]|uniref:hypothetical protein n=1 Tax=unclassified Cryobacterium TaxID=2649013 RepID=UPI001068E407|nr:MULTISPECIES: hypothetical protein [unclassified Cryobacterium]TFC26424.1 hypothetical protein E3O22_12380 [Cryobacterium sp. TMT2-18-2]TFC64398.1 hypothetical protein E3O53_07930 [Cryobacterium sp. TMT2-18-3]